MIEKLPDMPDTAPGCEPFQFSQPELANKINELVETVNYMRDGHEGILKMIKLIGSVVVKDPESQDIKADLEAWLASMEEKYGND